MAALKALGAAPAPPGPSLATPAQQARPPAPQPATEDLSAGAAAGATHAGAGAAAAAPTSVATSLQAALAAAAAMEQPLFQPQQLLGAAGLPGAGMPGAGIPGWQPWVGPSLVQAFGASQPAAPVTQLLSQQQAVLFSQQAALMQLGLPVVKQEPLEGASPAGRQLAAVKQEPGTVATGAAAGVQQEPGSVGPGFTVLGIAMPAVKREPGTAGGRGEARGRAGGRGRGKAAAAAAAKPLPRAAKGRRQVVSDSSESEPEEAATTSSSRSSSSSEEESEEEEYAPPPRHGRRPAANPKAAPAPRKQGRPPGKAAAGRGRANAAAAAAGSDEEEEAAAPKKRARKGTGHIDEPVLVEGGWMLDPLTPLIYRDVGGSGSKIAAFTLDGTICLTKMGLPYAGSASDWMYAYPGVPERLAQLQQEGFMIVIMNNQGNVKGALNGKASANARGKVDAVLDSMAMHGVDGTRVKVLLAPSMDALRKPDPGMWHFMANRLYSGVNIDKSQSFYVGDSDGDSGLASAVGLRCFRPASFFKGPSSGAATSFGVLGNGRAVSDYAAVSPELLPHVLQLQVLGWHPAALFTDHATLHLEVAIPSGQPQRGAAEQPPAQQGQVEWQPAPQLRQFLPPRDPAQLAQAVQALTSLCGELSALADAADAASTVTDLNAVTAWLNEAVCSALAAGGLRERRQQQRQPQPQRKLPRHLSQEFGIRQLRRAVRQATAGGQAAQAAELRQQLKRAARKAHRTASQLRGQAHEELMRSDPSAFFRPFNKAAKAMSAIPSDTLVRHFCSLLGGDQPAEEPPPPEPPPEPPPAAGAAQQAQQESMQAHAPAVQPQPTRNPCSSARPPCSSARPSELCTNNSSSCADTAEGSTQQAAAASPQGSRAGGSPPKQAEQLASLKARMHAPFTPAEVAAHCKQLKNRKAVAGSLPPWFLKTATAQLAPALAALFNAWVRVGQLSAADALSLITAIPKPGAASDSCDGLRGIAVGTLPAKLFACIMERRISDWAEASGSRAAGQFGFRRQRSTGQAALVLRTLQDQHRSRGQQLFAVWVDFRKAYDCIPRQLLWQKLAARGLSGSWLRGVQALYADVPMSVCTADGPSPCFQARIGLKQGCPLSPTLFGLFIDDFEGEVLAAAQRGEQLDLPSLASSGSLMPPLLYADDMALLATSAAGLQRQLDMLQAYCRRWGLTVNTVKTKVQLLSGERTQQAAVLAAERAQLRFSGQLLEVVSAFKYLGITFSSATCLAGTAAPARAKAAGAALHNCRARCAALGIEAASAQLQLFSSLVDSVLSYGAEVWGPQLAAKAASGNGNTGCAAERLHLSFLRHLLGVRQGTPNAVVLAETGQRPLWARWLLRAARLWNRALAAPPDSLLRQAVLASTALAAEPGSRSLARQPWAQQLAAALAAVGVQLDLADPQPVSRAAVRAGCQERQLEQLMAAAERSGATKVQHYVLGTRGGTIDAASLNVPAAYLSSVRERSRRRALAQWRTGSFWGLEETGRWQQLPREQRICPHCQGGIETVHHMIFDCPLYDAIRLRFPDLFNCPATLHAFFEQPAQRLAPFAAACRRCWLDASLTTP